MYQVTQFANGLRLATAEMPHLASVSIGLWVGLGSRCEPKHLNGVCHFIEHLLFKGTSRRTAQEISQAIEGLGGYLNAFTGEESTCFHARAGHEHTESILDVLFDMLLNSQFAPQDVRKERGVIKEEIAMYLDEPQHHVQELLNAVLWPDQPLGRSITGTPATLDRLGRRALLEYLRTNYVTGAIVVVAAGRIKHRQLRRALRPYLDRPRVGIRSGFIAARNDQHAPRVHLCTKPTEQTQLALGIRTCSRHDERRYALRLLNALLGENMSSRLFQVIREDHGLAYSISSTPSFFADTGDLVISAGLETGNVDKTLKLIARELRRLKEKPPGSAELNRARDYVIGQMDLSLESADNQMNWLGEQLLGYGRIFSADLLKRKLKQITPRHVQQAARIFFKPEHVNLALVSPLRSSRALVRSLGI